MTITSLCPAVYVIRCLGIAILSIFVCGPDFVLLRLPSNYLVKSPAYNINERMRGPGHKNSRTPALYTRIGYWPDA